MYRLFSKKHLKCINLFYSIFLTLDDAGILILRSIYWETKLLDKGQQLLNSRLGVRLL